AEEVAGAHDPYAGDVLHGALVDREDRRARPVARLAARAHHASVQHARYADVVDVRVRADDLLRDRLAREAGADERVVGDRLRDPATGVELRDADRRAEKSSADELAVRDRLAAAGDDPVAHRERAGVDAELR